MSNVYTSYIILKEIHIYHEKNKFLRLKYLLGLIYTLFNIQKYNFNHEK